MDGGQVVVSQESTVTGILSLIAELRAEEKELMKALEGVRSNIVAAQRTSALLHKEQGLQPESPGMEQAYEKLRGMTHLKALMTLAVAKGGRVKVTAAKRILLEAGVITRPKTAYQQITAILLRSNRFVRTDPGEYILLSEESNGD